LLVLLAAGCAERGASGPGTTPPWVDVPDGTQIAIRGPRSRVVLLAVRPPYAVGPSSQMVIKKGRISGQHRGMGFVLDTSAGLIYGTGPGGPVDMDVWGDDHELRAEGSWNGQIGRLRINQAGMRISVASGPGRNVCGRNEGSRYYSAYFRRTSSGELLQSEGAFERQDYALEVGDRLTSYLSREEIAALLMTVLSGASPRGIDPLACGPLTGRRW
jgi:hypothetical protein